MKARKLDHDLERTGHVGESVGCELGEEFGQGPKSGWKTLTVQFRAPGLKGDPAYASRGVMCPKPSTSTLEP